jgi:hypothetical protein
MPGSLERALEGMLVPMCKVRMERAHAPGGGAVVRSRRSACC